MARLLHAVPIRWRKTAGITVLVFASLTALGYTGWQMMTRYFVHGYYQKEYQPVELTVKGAALPERVHLDNLPWIASDLPVCQSVSLQMIAAQHGVEVTRSHVDFLMAFTYGFSQVPGTDGFFPGGTDPETGLRDAAPYLGLARRYYVADDPLLFEQGLREMLAAGYPVRVGVDMGTLHGSPKFAAHSEVFVGYDPDGFYIYETVCRAPAPCTPGVRQPGAEGMPIRAERVIEATRLMSKSFQYPWRYALTIFEPGPISSDLAPVWARLATATLGSQGYGPATGVRVLEETAERIARAGKRFEPEDLVSELELAAIFRRENAGFLREAFAGRPEIEKAASLLEQAAGEYESVRAGLNDGIAGPEEAAGVADRLRAAAALEREAGAIFKALGER